MYLNHQLSEVHHLKQWITRKMIEMNYLVPDQESEIHQESPLDFLPLTSTCWIELSHIKW